METGARKNWIPSILALVPFASFVSISYHRLNCSDNKDSGKPEHFSIFFTCAVNGQWNCWTTWSACSVTCKGGVQSQMRSCNNPSPQHGGKNCSGESMVTRSCNVRPCPGSYILITTRFLSRAIGKDIFPFFCMSGLNFVDDEGRKCFV